MEYRYEHILIFVLFSKFENDLQVFDMKILFLITALCSEIRQKVKDEMHGLKYLIELLQHIILQNNANHNADKKICTGDLSVSLHVLLIAYIIYINQIALGKRS